MPFGRKEQVRQLMNNDVFLAGLIGLVLGLLILPLSLQPLWLIAVPSVVAVAGYLVAKALLDRWQIEQQNTRNLLESINFTLQTAISHTHQQACEMAATIKALETTTEVQTRDIQETVTQSYEVISAQIKGFNEQYSRKIEAEYQISTNILKNTAENLRGINDVTKQFSESVTASQLKLVSLQETFQRNLTTALDAKLDELQDRVDDALTGIRRDLDRNTKIMADDIQTLVERSHTYQKEISLAVSNQQANQEMHREEVRNIIKQMSELNHRDIELMEKIISHG